MKSLNRRIERIEEEQQEAIISEDDPIAKGNPKADMIIGKSWDQVADEMHEWAENRNTGE